MELELPRWMLNIFCAVVGAAIAMAVVTACSPESGQELKVIAYGLYAFMAAFVVVANHEQKVEGPSDSKVTASLVLFALATVGGGISFYTQVFWPWGIGMILGIVVLLPTRIASRVY